MQIVSLTLSSAIEGKIEMLRWKAPDFFLSYILLCLAFAKTISGHVGDNFIFAVEKLHFFFQLKTESHLLWNEQRQIVTLVFELHYKDDEGAHKN